MQTEEVVDTGAPRSTTAVPNGNIGGRAQQEDTAPSGASTLRFEQRFQVHQMVYGKYCTVTDISSLLACPVFSAVFWMSNINGRVAESVSEVMDPAPVVSIADPSVHLMKAADGIEIMISRPLLRVVVFSTVSCNASVIMTHRPAEEPTDHRNPLTLGVQIG